MRARAVEFTAPGRVRVVEVTPPEPADGDAVVQTLYSGISSGTETLALRGEIDPRTPLDDKIGALHGTFSFPFRYGYSCVGLTEPGCSELGDGRLVFCFHPHQSVLVRPASELLPVDGIDARVATMLPLVETGLQIALDAGNVAGRVVVVTGLGTVGILAGAMLTARGARVLGAEPRPWRREAGGAFNLQVVTPDNLADAVAERTGGAGASVVVECSGDPAAAAQALELLEHEGTALLAGWYGRKMVPLPLGADFHRRRLSIRSTQVSTIPKSLQPEWTFERRRAEALSFLRSAPMEVLATHEFPLTEVQQAFDAVAGRATGLLHAALRYH